MGGGGGLAQQMKKSKTENENYFKMRRGALFLGYTQYQMTEIWH